MTSTTIMNRPTPAPEASEAARKLAGFRRVEERVCQLDGCGATFLGLRRAKYCSPQHARVAYYRSIDGAGAKREQRQRRTAQQLEEAS